MWSCLLIISRIYYNTLPAVTCTAPTVWRTLICICCPLLFSTFLCSLRSVLTVMLNNRNEDFRLGASRKRRKSRPKAKIRRAVLCEGAKPLPPARGSARGSAMSGVFRISQGGLQPNPPPIPGLPFPPIPLVVGPLNPARGSGYRCKLPQRGLGRSPSRNRFWCIFALKSDIWWQRF